MCHRWVRIHNHVPPGCGIPPDTLTKPKTPKFDTSVKCMCLCVCYVFFWILTSSPHLRQSPWRPFSWWYWLMNCLMPCSLTWSASCFVWGQDSGVPSDRRPMAEHSPRLLQTAPPHSPGASLLCFVPCLAFPAGPSLSAPLDRLGLARCLTSLLPPPPDA